MRYMILAIAIFGILLLYVLSVGPVMWLIAHRYLPVAFARVYDPIWKLPILRDFIDWEIRQMP
jgi:hypothetical protein